RTLQLLALLLVVRTATPTPALYALSLHDALPIYPAVRETRAARTRTVTTPPRICSVIRSVRRSISVSFSIRLWACSGRTSVRWASSDTGPPWVSSWREPSGGRARVVPPCREGRRLSWTSVGPTAVTVRPPRRRPA